MSALAQSSSAAAVWAPGPAEPQLIQGAVHLWLVDLTTVSDELTGPLSTAEYQRSARMLDASDGRLWARSRGMLRELLGRYLSQDPARISLTVGPHGKPALATCDDEAPAATVPAQARAPELSFNLSHSGTLALYAFSHAGAVGVDVEVVRRPVEEVAIAARLLGAEAAECLRAITDPELRRKQFLRAWTCHEATLKCLGTGIGGTAPERGEPTPWTGQLDLHAGPEVAAALACEHAPRELCHWTWRP